MVKQLVTFIQVLKVLICTCVFIQFIGPFDVDPVALDMLLAMSYFYSLCLFP